MKHTFYSDTVSSVRNRLYLYIHPKLKNGIEEHGSYGNVNTRALKILSYIPTCNEEKPHVVLSEQILHEDRMFHMQL
jgi:hypothetical protein